MTQHGMVAKYTASIVNDMLTIHLLDELFFCPVAFGIVHTLSNFLDARQSTLRFFFDSYLSMRNK